MWHAVSMIADPGSCCCGCCRRRATVPPPSHPSSTLSPMWDRTTRFIVSIRCAGHGQDQSAGGAATAQPTSAPHSGIAATQCAMTVILPTDGGSKLEIDAYVGAAQHHHGQRRVSFHFPSPPLIGLQHADTAGGGGARPVHAMCDGTGPECADQSMRYGW